MLTNFRFFLIVWILFKVARTSIEHEYNSTYEYSQIHMNSESHSRAFNPFYIPLKLVTVSVLSPLQTDALFPPPSRLSLAPRTHHILIALTHPIFLCPSHLSAPSHPFVLCVSSHSPSLTFLFPFKSSYSIVPYFSFFSWELSVFRFAFFRQTFFISHFYLFCA